MSDVYAEKPWLKNYDKDVSPTLTYEKKTFAEKFQESVEKYPNKTALIYMGRELTYRDLDELSNQLAQYFISIGLKPDDVVAVSYTHLTLPTKRIV